MLNITEQIPDTDTRAFDTYIKSRITGGTSNELVAHRTKQVTRKIPVIVRSIWDLMIYVYEDTHSWKMYIDIVNKLRVYCVANHDVITKLELDKVYSKLSVIDEFFNENICERYRGVHITFLPVPKPYIEFFKSVVLEPVWRYNFIKTYQFFVRERKRTEKAIWEKLIEKKANREIEKMITKMNLATIGDKNIQSISQSAEFLQTVSTTTTTTTATDNSSVSDNFLETNPFSTKYVLRTKQMEANKETGEKEEVTPTIVNSDHEYNDPIVNQETDQNPDADKETKDLSYIWDQALYPQPLI